MSLPPPDWLRGVPEAFDGRLPPYFGQFPAPTHPRRQSAVLIVFAPNVTGGTDVVLTERSRSLRAHPGQVSFPGGALEASDDGLVAAALRETEEEVGIPATEVEVIASLPVLYMTPSENAVTPVLGWWPSTAPVRTVDTREVERAERIALSELLDPVNRFTVTHPSGYRGPGFEVSDMFVWGFTARLLSEVLELGEVARPWDQDLERPIPERVLTDWQRART